MLLLLLPMKLFLRFLHGLSLYICHMFVHIPSPERGLPGHLDLSCPLSHPQPPFISEVNSAPSKGLEPTILRSRVTCYAKPYGIWLLISYHSSPTILPLNLSLWLQWLLVFQLTEPARHLISHPFLTLYLTLFLDSSYY